MNLMPVLSTQDGANKASATGALNSWSVQQDILAVINAYYVRSKPQVDVDCKMSTDQLDQLDHCISITPSATRKSLFQVTVWVIQINTCVI